MPKNYIVIPFFIVFIVIFYTASLEAARNPFKPKLPMPVFSEPLAGENVTRPDRDFFQIERTDPFVREEPNIPPSFPKENQREDILPLPVEPIQESEESEEIVPPELAVQGLIWKSERPQAIINNRVVDVGDSVLDAKIVDIRKSSIDIQYQGMMFTIKP
jgi:hypothetical protein